MRDNLYFAENGRTCQTSSLPFKTVCHLSWSVSRTRPGNFEPRADRHFTLLKVTRTTAIKALRTMCISKAPSPSALAMIVHLHVLNLTAFDTQRVLSRWEVQIAAVGSILPAAGIFVDV